MKHALIILLIFSTALHAFLDFQIWDGNQITNWWGNTGHMSTHIPTGDAGMEWPAGSGDSPVFASGLWVTTSHVNGVQEARSAAAEFSSEYAPGPWGSDPDSSTNRIYKIRTADGRANPDWDIWPVDQGAPWVDVDEDGEYDPAIDYPDVKGDLYYWTIFNDGNSVTHANLWSTQPLGIEISAASYGFEGPSPLENTLFFEWKIRNAGTDVLDSVTVGIWQDIDLGSAINDYPGCVPELDLSYHYVGELPDTDYGFYPPAVGFTILQGPIVYSPGDSAWVDGELLIDYRTLGSTAFVAYNSSYNGDPETAWEAYLNMQGLRHNGTAFVDSSTLEPTTFCYAGNPLDGTGWLAENETWPRDWRTLLSTGPFSLAPGETQQVVAACVISPGMDPLAALAALFDDVEIVHEIYDDQFTTLDDIIEISELDIPHNTESSGPFSFEFEILDSQNSWSGSKYLHVEFNSQSNSYLLTHNGENFWQADIPDFGISETSVASYYIMHVAGPEVLEFWPSGAPYNSNLFTFGPDADPPIVAGLQQHHDVHYLLPFNKSVTIDTVYDARFGIDDIWLNWTIGGSDIMTAPMVAIDSNEVNWHPNTIYQGQMNDVVSQVGDTVRYWVTALDGSINNLAGSSEIGTFVTANSEVIADFDHIGQLVHLLDWHPFEHGMLSQYSDADGNWLNVILLAVNADGTPADTMEMVREIDLTPFDAAWFNIPMVASFRNAVNYGLVQVKAGGVYHTLDSLYGTIPPGTYSYDLAPFLDQTDVSLRLIMNRGFGSMRWIVDDVVFHTDPNLVSINEPGLLPLTFSLRQNYPNPFNPSTRIEYALPEHLDVNFTIYDLRGREMKSFSFKDQAAGIHDIQWDGHNKMGQLAAAGVYFGHLEAGEFKTTIKMVLVR